MEGLAKSSVPNVANLVPWFQRIGVGGIDEAIDHHHRLFHRSLLLTISMIMRRNVLRNPLLLLVALFAVATSAQYDDYGGGQQDDYAQDNLYHDYAARQEQKQQGGAVERYVLAVLWVTLLVDVSVRLVGGLAKRAEGRRGEVLKLGRPSPTARPSTTRGRLPIHVVTGRSHQSLDV